jgi:hypothetical protein
MSTQPTPPIAFRSPFVNPQDGILSLPAWSMLVKLWGATIVTLPAQLAVLTAELAALTAQVNAIPITKPLYSLSKAGALTVATDVTPRAYIVSSTSPSILRADVKTAPTGGPLTVVLSQLTPAGVLVRVATFVIAAGTYSATAAAAVVPAAGNFWRVDISSVGSVVAGSDLTVTIE